MLRPEPLDILIILVVAMLLFGANRLPESVRAIGKAMREFRNAVAGEETTESANDTKNAGQDSQRNSN